MEMVVPWRGLIVPHYPKADRRAGARRLLLARHELTEAIFADVNAFLVRRRLLA
jgi:hypothetical protein